MAIAIDKGIPLPPRGSGSPVPAKYPWLTMGVGDSFLVSGRTARNFSSQIHVAQKSTGRKFAARTADGGVRVWRTA